MACNHSGLRIESRSVTSMALVRAAGLEPARGFPQRIFVPATAFAAATIHGVCGLDYPFTLARFALGAARLVSTPSRRPFGRSGLARDCHVKGFPDFEQFCIPRFRESTQVLA